MTWWKRVLLVVAIAAIPVALALATLMNRPDDPEVAHGEITLEASGQEETEPTEEPETPSPTEEETPTEASQDPGEGTETGSATPGSGADEDGSATGEGRSGAQDDGPGAAAEGANAHALHAIALAEEHAGGRAYALEADDGRWEVRVAAGERSVELIVSAQGTDVVGTDSDDLDSEVRRGLGAAQVGLAEAIRIAVDHTGGVVDEAELDGDDRLWEIEVEGPDGGRDVDVDVVTGAIVAVD